MRLLIFIYPSDPFDKSVVDEAYSEEFNAVIAAGLPCSLFSFEDFEGGKFRARPALPAGADVIYRGWMMPPEAYTRLADAVAAEGARLKTRPNEYRLCHYLPEWYSLCEAWTPETIVAAKDADFVMLLHGKSWPAYFVKDYVKSLTTQRGSVAQTPEGIAAVVALIEQYRGSVEGGHMHSQIRRSASRNGGALLRTGWEAGLQGWGGSSTRGRGGTADLKSIFLR